MITVAIILACLSVVWTGMLPVHKMQFETGGRLEEILDCLAQSLVSYPVLRRATDLWTRFHQDMQERLQYLEGIIEVEVSRMAATLA